MDLILIRRSTNTFLIMFKYSDNLLVNNIQPANEPDMQISNFYSKKKNYMLKLEEKLHQARQRLEKSIINHVLP